MTHLNIEIKARCNDLGRIRTILLESNAEFRGLDRQIDTYYNCPNGRLKLRQGNIENALIHYLRPDQSGPKDSQVTLYEPAEAADLSDLLRRALGIQIVVPKEREIYFIDNVKFHLDRVASLGSFVEIEAIDFDGSIGSEKLHEQCRTFMERFAIPPSDLITCSYSDLLHGDSAGGLAVSEPEIHQ